MGLVCAEGGRKSNLVTLTISTLQLDFDGSKIHNDTPPIGLSMVWSEMTVTRGRMSHVDTVRTPNKIVNR